MPEPTITGSTYNGEFAGKYISAALLSAPTIDQGGITVMPNIKHKEVLQNLTTSTLLADASCDFDATGSTVTLTEKVLSVEDLQVNMQLCKSQFHSNWQAAEMGFSSFDELPKSFEDYLLAYAASKVAAEIEVSLWRGATASAGQFDGLVTLATADATVNDVVATTVTAANVIDELGKIVDSMNSNTNIYAKEDTRIYVSRNIMAAYVRALGGFAAAGVGANGVNNDGTMWYGKGAALSFDGIPLFLAEGLAANTAMAAQSSNLFFGTSLLSDHQEARVIDVSQYDGSDNVRVIMRLAAGAQIGVGADVVLYS
jgi:phosphotransferase system HPr-like phosphotransfer protein